MLTYNDKVNGVLTLKKTKISGSKQKFFKGFDTTQDLRHVFLL